MRVLLAILVLAPFVTTLQAATPQKSAAAKPQSRPTAPKLDSTREPKAFRGVSWNATEAEADEIINFGEYSCTDMSILKPAQRWCGSDFEMGSVEATSNFVFAEGKLVQVIVSYYPSEYEYVRSVFVEKYGPPSATTRIPVRTKAGVEYGNDTTIWRFPNVTIEMHRYGTTIDRGSTYITLNRWTNEKAAKEASSKKKAVESF